jgi:hypothetical protein
MIGQMNIREKNTISERVNQIWILLMNEVILIMLMRLNFVVGYQAM